MKKHFRTGSFKFDNMEVATTDRDCREARTTKLKAKGENQIFPHTRIVRTANEDQFRVCRAVLPPSYDDSNNNSKILRNTHGKLILARCVVLPKLRFSVKIVIQSSYVLPNALLYSYYYYYYY